MNLKTGKLMIWGGAALALLLVFPLNANDAEAAAVYKAGRELFLKAEYHDAAGNFADAELLADSPVVKANSLKAQIAAYRMCKLAYKEFQALEKLMQQYPESADFRSLSEREYELGDMYYRGYREPAFWVFRSIPWLQGPEKTLEIYQKALERAPFATQAASGRLRLAYLYDRDGNIPASIKELRTLVKSYPAAKEYKYALLALGNALFVMARKGDGDGRYGREAMEYFQRFEKEFPDADEVKFVKRHLLILQDIQSKRLYDIADFYQKNGKTETSKRYLAQLLQSYPDSAPAIDAEKKLVKQDQTFIPGDFKEKPVSRLAELKIYELPKEAASLLIAPQNSERKFLVPIYDLRIDTEKKIQKENVK